MQTPLPHTQSTQAPPPHIIFHVGMAKTGTTSIQYFFRENYEKALDLGLLYPRAGASNNGLAHHSWHKTFSAEKRAGVDDWISEGDAPAMLQQLEAETLEHSPRKLLFSSESFQPDSVARLLASIPHRHATVLFFLRRADHLLEAQYAQGIKTGRHKMSPDQFLDHALVTRPQWLHPHGLLAGYAALEAELVIQPFERQQIGPTLVRRFLELVGIEEMADLETEFAENERLHPLLTQLLAARHDEERLIGGKYVALRRHLNEILAKTKAGIPSSFFSPRQRRMILDEAAGDYRSIAEELMGRRPGELFLEPPPDINASWQPPVALTVSDTADLLLDLWDAVWAERQGNRQKGSA